MTSSEIDFLYQHSIRGIYQLFHNKNKVNNFSKESFESLLDLATLDFLNFRWKILQTNYS